MDKSFKAFFVSENNGKYTGEVKEVNTNQLPDNDLLIQVKYSSLNFKDVLSVTGNKGVTTKFPHVPGIDASGIVVQSNNDEFPEGTEVVVTGFDLGMNTWGGFGEYISVPAEWVIALPEGLTLKTAMCYGTAGLTAGLSVHQLIDAAIKPEDGEVAVSGATGGVGSIAVAILAKLGYDVVTISGKTDDDFLMNLLGAKRMLNRDEFAKDADSGPMTTPAFSAAIDCVGGPILSGLLKSTKYNGIVTSCGMVASLDLNTSIFPFIIRGITLSGIDSVNAPIPVRQEVWDLLGTVWLPDNLEKIVQEISLSELQEKLDLIGKGGAIGRYILVHD